MNRQSSTSKISPGIPAGNIATDNRLIYIKYRDHVFFHRSDPLVLLPQVRECIGWLVYNATDYIIVSWDRDVSGPSIKGGDPKASGLVLLRSDILEMRMFDQV